MNLENEHQFGYQQHTCHESGLAAAMYWTVERLSATLTRKKDVMKRDSGSIVANLFGHLPEDMVSRIVFPLFCGISTAGHHCRRITGCCSYLLLLFCL